MTALTPDLIAAHQLTPEEYDKIVSLLGREPTYTELGIFSVMWSEHCSYKSSRLHLKKLPTRSKHVLVGPGENAGIIDIGGDYAIAFKIESHNHRVSSSLSRAPRPASAAFCAISSPWAPVPSLSWMRCGSGRSTIR